MPFPEMKSQTLNIYHSAIYSLPVTVIKYKKKHFYIVFQFYTKMRSPYERLHYNLLNAKY